MNGGRFIAGTEKHPHQHQLQFILYGGYYGKQQPMFGNKGIGCLNCKLSIYGQPRTKTWTTLAATVNIGDTTLTLSEAVDWQVGEQIVIASTSFDHYESERKTISAISGQTVTIDSPFAYKHVSVLEAHGADTIEMRAEVGLLTRNIKISGDDSSEMKQYGSHLMMTGQSVNGLEGQVAYAEFFHCGQPQILGRYCIHFHMAGDVPTSFVRGNAVHDSFARITTIHGVYHLTVELNVGHRVKGHNFFVEDGIETHNVIRNNLAVSSIQTTRMLQTDTSVASFWVTNPTNDFYGNHAAGSDFYGIWYEIKENPDGPSATMDVCPVGNPLGTVTNNVAHSNLRFGLRIFVLASRFYPCDPIRNDTDPNDPWGYNPSMTSTFSNFTVYKNLEDGVLAEQTGNVVFDNFRIAENYHAGIEFYLANFTREPPTIQNSFIIGKSDTNYHPDPFNYTNNMSGAITGRSGTNKFSNIRFYNYPAGSILFQTCRLCDDVLKYTNLGTEVVVDQLSFSNVNGKLLYMIGALKRDIIYDLDGSFAAQFDGTPRASATIVHGFPHIAAYNQNTCPSASTPGDWDDAVMCGPTETLRRVMFSNMIDWQLFNGQYLKAVQLAGINDTVDPALASGLFTSVVTRIDPIMEPKVEQKYTWSLPFILGKTYSIWWGTGIDFTHLAIFTSPTFTSVDSGVIFKFNYTENRELFEVGPMRGGAKALTTTDFFTESTGYLDVSSCSNGQYFRDNSETASRMMEICISGNNKTLYQYTEVNGIKCRYLCPAPAGTFIKEGFVRLWSNATQWPNGVVPQAGDNVTLNGNWTVELDVDPAPLNYLILDGTLFAKGDRDVNLTANSIWIRAGNLTAGSTTTPFVPKFTLQINGQKSDAGHVIDPIIAGNKFLVVTGILNLHGTVPSTTETTLSETAFAGSSTISVDSSTGWTVGDQLVLTPSFSKATEHETAIIQSINSDGTITLTSALQYTHYGAGSVTISNNYGTLDTRTRVGHLSRNIKILPGPDAGWGFTVIIYGFMDGQILRVGAAQVSGVQFKSGGQLETLNAPLTFINSRSGNYTSTLTQNAFVGCSASCVYIKNSHNITFTRNILYSAYVFGAQITLPQYLTFSSNLIVGVTGKPTIPEGTELTACLYYVEKVPLTAKVSVKDNYCLGSTQHGFAVPFASCGDFEANPIANNTAGATKIGFIINTIDEQCQAFSYAKAFASQIGQICGPPGISSIRFDHFLMADNQRSITLKLGDHEGRTDHSAYLFNSYVSAISRPNCSECYGSSATICSDNHGLRLFTASANGEVLPVKFGTGFDVVCKQPVYDSKSFLENCTFDNFRQTYTGSVAGCSSNFVFKPHTGGFDMVGSANLFGSLCTNCDANSYLKAPQPSSAQLGWFGGCGDILCTGYNNYLIQDHTGSFFGSQATIVANNSDIGLGEAGCTFSAPMNAYMCSRSDFGVLEYQNIAADFQSRIMWPVTLTYEGSNYSTVSNGWREWEWLGNEPQNKRFGRFVTVVRLNQTYNMTFASMPPEKLQLQLQRRTDVATDDTNNYVVVKLHHPKPNSIRVLLNNQIVDPILLTDVNNTASGVMTPLNTSQCGSNIYFYTNYTTHFVVTSDPTCLISVELTESVQLTTHFATNISDFFSSTNPLTNFINNLCALLNIVDTSRVKVVGVHSGSTAITVSFTPPTNSSVAPNDPSLATIASAASGANASFTSALGGIGLGAVISVSSAYYPLTSDSTETSEGSKVGLIVGVIVAALLLMVGVIVTAVCCIRKRSKVVE
jgi:hypothetical protein